jgi:glycosyltransferase involved in cell wall biosynthesis
MGNWPVVSALIPTYNGAPFIGQTIESALAQDYPALEVIVGDDASTDETRQILAGFGDRIRVIAFPENRGNGALRNQLVAEARGKYIALLDHDDHWLPGKITAQVRAMEQSPAAALCHTASEIFGDESGDGPIVEEVRRRVQGQCFDELFRRNGIVISTVMARASALPKPCFWTDLGGVRDYGLWLRLLFAGEAVYLPQVTTRYRKHQGQITQDVGGSRNLQILAGAARLRVLDEFGPRMEPARAASLRQWALDELERCTYSRYWQGDMVQANRGFALLRQAGRPVPLRHRFRAKAMALLRGSAPQRQDRRMSSSLQGRPV